MFIFSNLFRDWWVVDSDSIYVGTLCKSNHHPYLIHTSLCLVAVCCNALQHSVIFSRMKWFQNHHEWRLNTCQIWRRFWILHLWSVGVTPKTFYISPHVDKFQISPHLSFGGYGPWGYSTAKMPNLVLPLIKTHGIFGWELSLQYTCYLFTYLVINRTQFCLLKWVEVEMSHLNPLSPCRPTFCNNYVTILWLQFTELWKTSCTKQTFSYGIITHVFYHYLYYLAFMFSKFWAKSLLSHCRERTGQYFATMPPGVKVY